MANLTRIKILTTGSTTTAPSNIKTGELAYSYVAGTQANNGDRLYFSRRPVDTIVNITFTQSRVPKKISKKRYLSEIADKIEFKKFTAAFSKKKLIYGEKKLQSKFFYVNLQMVSSSKRKEFVRKYFFFVDNKVVVMTIVSFHRPRKSTYSSFESFIKKLST